MSTRGRGRKRKRGGNPNFGRKKMNSSEPVDPAIQEYLDELNYVYREVNK